MLSFCNVYMIKLCFLYKWVIGISGLAIDEAETALRSAEKFIEMEGQEALRKAKEAQERFGQQSQRMTDIAKEAREEAER